MEASHAYIDTLETRYPICVNNTDVCDRVLHAVHVLRQAYATYELHAGVYRIRLAFIDKLHFTRNQLEQVRNFLPSSLSPFLSIYLPSSSLSPFLPLYLPSFLSISLPSSLSPFFSLYLPSFLSIYLPSSLSPFLPLYLPSFLSISLPSSLSPFFSLYLPSFLSIYLPSSLSPFLPLYLPSFLSISLPSSLLLLLTVQI